MKKVGALPTFEVKRMVAERWWQIKQPFGEAAAGKCAKANGQRKDKRG
jgi:hypothetical protein